MLWVTNPKRYLISDLCLYETPLRLSSTAGEVISIGLHNLKPWQPVLTGSNLTSKIN